MEQWQVLLLVWGINFCAAFLQACTGAGYAIVAMSLMPFLLPMRTCSAVSAAVVVAIGTQMVILLHRHMRLRAVLFPTICCLASINLGMYILMHCEERVLRIVLCVFLLVLTGFFYFTQKRSIVIRRSIPNSIVCGVITGIATGIFNIVGPLFMVYYFHTSDGNMEYKANLEFTFLAAGLYSTFLHILYGNMNTQALPYVGAAVAAAVAAGFLGLAVFRRIRRETVSRIIYAVLPVMALLLLRS